MLSAAQMAQMNRLLDEALDLDPEGRRRWLEALAPEYEDLKAALSKALLPEPVAAESGNLATLPKLDGAEATETGSGLQAGALVGPYRLVRPLGAGGMAEVWLAQRADGAFKREVALKLPMPSRPRKDLASRFARERDILAALEHPNIARLYDAGVSSQGLPYLAMEYVHGEPLTAWCDAHRLGIRERLKLFLQVLDAVQYAHGHQVIHRDIKPSNILVTDSGQVRLLDFGVAKLLAEEDEHTQLTQIYGRALTPDYASPELVRGEPIDAVADVYSLGVMLYELLAGSRPYHLKAGASIRLLEQAIATAQVERPSTQVGAEAGATRASSQQKLARSLRGDLDAIVLKALAKAPAERYPSAEALADDLQRYVSGEPVEAHPDRLAYRLGKFVLRHRAGVPTAVAVVLVMAAMGYALIRREAFPGAPPPVQNAGGPSGIAVPIAVAANDKSIAVLPFVDMSEHHDQEYFSDGLSEELIDHLSHSRDLKVIARTSSFSFKGKSDDV
jgi:eukaryotic-like serine/threonine-protein kinase